MRYHYTRTPKFPGLRLLLLTMLVSAGMIQGAHGQGMPNYAFSNSSGVYTPISGAILPTLSGGDLDDGWFNNIPIGFPLVYNGVYYTSLSASTNGWF